MMLNLTSRQQLFVFLSFVFFLSGCNESGSDMGSVGNSSSSSSSGTSSSNSSGGSDFMLQLEGITKLDVSLTKPIGWLDGVTEAILDDTTASVYNRFLDDFYASGAFYGSEKFKPVKDVFLSSTAAILSEVSKLAFAVNIIPELLDDTTRPDITVIRNAERVLQTSPVFGNLFSYSVKQTVDDVTVDLTIDLFFHLPGAGGPSGGFHQDARTQHYTFEKMLVNITGSVRAGDVSLTFAPAESGVHISGTINLEFPPAGSADPINLLVDDIKTDLPIVLSDGIYTFVTNIGVDLPAGIFEISVADVPGDTSLISALLLDDFYVNLGLKLFNDRDSVQSTVKLKSVTEDIAEVELAWDGTLESLQLKNEFDDSFLPIHSSLDFGAMLHDNSVEIDLIKKRIAATKDRLELTVKTALDTVTVNYLVRSKDGSIIELDAVKTSTGESATVSNGLISIH